MGTNGDSMPPPAALSPPSPASTLPPSTAAKSWLDSANQFSERAAYRGSCIPELKGKCKQLTSKDDALVLDGLCFVVRTLASLDMREIIEVLISYDILPILMELLVREAHKPKIVDNVILVVSNMVCGTMDQVMRIVDAGVIPRLLSLSISPNANTREKTLWALFNLSSTHVDVIKNMMAHGLMCRLMWILGKHITPEAQPPRHIHIPTLLTMRNVSTICTNILRCGITPSLETARAISDIAGHYIFSPDPELAAESLCALSTLANYGTEFVQLVLKKGMLKRMVQLYDEAMTAEHADGVDKVTASVDRDSVSQGIKGMDDSHTRQQVNISTSNNIAQLLIRTSCVKLIHVLSRSSDRLQYLTLLSPSLNLLNILMVEVNLYTDLSTAIEACRAVSNCTLSIAAEDAGFSGRLVARVLLDLGSAPLIAQLDAAFSHGASELSMAAMETFNALCHTLPVQTLVQTALYPALRRAAELFTAAAVSDAAVDPGLLRSSLSACERGVAAVAMGMGGASGVAVRQGDPRLEGVLEHLVEPLEALELYPDVEIAHCAMRLGNETLPAALAAVR